MVTKSIRNIDIRRTWGFLCVGLLNTAFGYIFYAALIFFDVPYPMALLMATATGAIFNFFSFGRLVFKSDGGLIVFVKFISTYGLLYFVNVFMLAILTEGYGFNLYAGQMIYIPASTLLSWLVMNYWVYKRS